MGPHIFTNYALQEIHTCSAKTSTTAKWGRSNTVKLYRTYSASSEFEIILPKSNKLHSAPYAWPNISTITSNKKVYEQS